MPGSTLEHQTSFIDHLWPDSNVSGLKVVQYFTDLVKMKGLKVAVLEKNMSLFEAA